MSFSKNLISAFFLIFFFSVSISAQNTCSVEIAPSDTAVCLGKDMSLLGLGSPAGGTYLWTGTTVKTKKLTWPVTKDTIFYVQYNAPNSCIAYDTVHITAIGFDASLATVPDRDTIEQGESIVLTAKVTPNSGTYSYDWEENGTLMFGSNTSTVETILDTNLDKYSFSVLIQDQNGCARDITKTFTIIVPEFIAPNAFTPDGDGNNDRFALIPRYGTLDIETFQIYNRWGEIVYNGTGSNASWDGRFNDQPQPTGVYYFVARVRKGKEAALAIEKGEVNLIR